MFVIVTNTNTVVVDYRLELVEVSYNHITFSKSILDGIVSNTKGATLFSFRVLITQMIERLIHTCQFLSQLWRVKKVHYVDRQHALTEGVSYS